MPYAFTEHGAIMAASILNSERADEMSIFVVRAFIRMRETLTGNQQFISRLEQIERRIGEHEADIQDLLEAVRELMVPPPTKDRRRIGFTLPINSAKGSAKSR